MNDHEYTTTSLYGLRIYVDKVGGGTVGKAYENQDWEVTVLNGSVFVYDRDIMTVPGPATHRDVAKRAAEFAGETL